MGFELAAPAEAVSVDEAAGALAAGAGLGAARSTAAELDRDSADRAAGREFPDTDPSVRTLPCT